MKVPRLVVNAKAYPEATGPASVALAQVACRNLGVEVAWCAAATDLTALAAARIPRLQVWGQHVDGREPGAATGWLTAEMVKSSGAAGTLLNHAEHKLPAAELASCVARARAAGLQIILCADSTSEAVRLVTLTPDAIAIEPPQLIGGTVSVTSADPAIVRNAVTAVRSAPGGRNIPVLCGAGVKNGHDVRAALELGAHGVLLASGLVKAANPAAALKDLASGLA